MSQKRLNVYIFLSFFIGLLASCSEDNPEPETEGPSLGFTAEIYEGEPGSRGPESGVLRREEFDMRIFVAMKVGEMKKGNAFLVPEDQPGILRSYQEERPITWQSVQSPHYFYGWTLPWLEKDPYLEDGELYLKDGTPLSFEPGHEMYSKIEDNGTVTSSYDYCLERFIGASNGPVTYNENGEYVNLQFRHLVSKIYINNFRYAYIDKDGKPANPSVTGEMTLIGLPAQGFFYREGENGPIVIPDPESTQVTYNVASKTTLYVCPNIDLSKIEYRITSSSKVIESAGDFLGDFSSISLTRDLDDWWVKKNMQEHPESDPATTLYAGEILTLNLTLRQSIGNYIAASVGNWGTKDPREAGAYPYPGFYNGNELKNMSNYFQNGYTEELEDRMFNDYGDKDNNEYRLYNDIDGINYGFKTGKKYVLNGLGHTLTIRPYSSGVVKITKCYDIYITDGNGHTIYIDNNFDVYIVNDDGSMTKVNHLEDIPDGKQAYDINLSTGSYTFSNS